MKLKIIFLIKLIICFSFSAMSQTTNVNISGIENLEGVIMISVFESQQQFDDEKPARNINVDKSNITNGNKTVQLNLKPGTYALTILDDEDEDGDMTYRFGVYPLEGIGFSNFILEGMKKPSFSDFSFRVSETGSTVNVKMKYF